MPNTTIFGDSELILRNQRIYHLDLHPDEIATTVITVGDPNRVPNISKYFDSVDVMRSHREFVTHTGYIGQQRLSVVSTGISTANIDIVINELDALHNICFDSRTIKSTITPMTLVRLGTSGALQADIPVDSVVLSKASIGFNDLMPFYDMLPDPNQHAFQQQLTSHFEGHLPLVPHYIESSPRLQELFKHFTTPGITATCGGFYAPQGRILRAQAKHSNFIEKLSSFSFQQQRLTNMEMETLAIYGLSRVLGFECCSMSAIINNRANKTFSNHIEQTLDTLIQTTLEHLTKS